MRASERCHFLNLRGGCGWVILCAVLGQSSGSVHAQSAVSLRESLAAESSTQVRIELRAEGLFRPGLPPSAIAPEAKMPKPLALEVKTRLIFHERILKPSRNRSQAPAKETTRPDQAAAGETVKAVRWVTQAASAINGDIRPTAASLRPELSLLVAQRSDDDSGTVVVSPAGPMTRSELELVQGLGDPLALGEILPSQAVEKGDKWPLPPVAVFALTGYDTVKSTTLEGSLERVDDREARIRLVGEVRGAVLGGTGKITCEGFATYDRRAGLVDRLELNRTEDRQAGPVEAGLEVKSTLTVVRRPAQLAPELADTALADLTLEVSPERRLLQLVSPDGKYNLLHDRQWHTYWDDPKLVVLKRLEKGQVIAQCNLSTGPAAGKGKHQDLAQFREDIKRSLGQRFVQFLGAGEVDGDPAGGFRYKVGVQGREGELGVLWSYYLIASPEGDQLLATFTLAEQDSRAFGEQDLELIGSLQWTPPAPKKP